METIKEVAGESSFGNGRWREIDVSNDSLSAKAVGEVVTYKRLFCVLVAAVESDATRDFLSRLSQLS